MVKNTKGEITKFQTFKDFVLFGATEQSTILPAVFAKSIISKSKGIFGGLDFETGLAGISELDYGVTPSFLKPNKPLSMKLGRHLFEENSQKDKEILTIMGITKKEFKKTVMKKLQILIGFLNLLKSIF
ncbi:hypothetical protein ACIQAA_27260 [Neobacillus sp. NPDC093182]|uniref:hypothetical protein n=1 Tax=Neobacillus sp. NPDC093182 TaxID=3364297 RepID=UPI0037F9DB72